MMSREDGEEKETGIVLEEGKVKNIRDRTKAGTKNVKEGEGEKRWRQ